MPVVRGVRGPNGKWQVSVCIDRGEFNDVSNTRLFRSVDKSVNDCGLVRAQWRKEKHCFYARNSAAKGSFVRKIELAELDLTAKLLRGPGSIAHGRANAGIFSAEMLNYISTDGAGRACYQN
jgi:hypothetical protein